MSNEHDEDFLERWYSIGALFVLYAGFLFATAFLLWLVAGLSWSQAMGGAALPAFAAWVVYLEYERRKG